MVSIVCSKRRDYEPTKLHSMNQITVLTRPERHRRWRKDKRKTILAAAFASGASVTSVTRRYDVATSPVYKWCQQALLATTDEVSFAPAVVVTDPTPPPETAAAEDGTSLAVELSDRTRVSIRTRASASCGFQ
jgi:transposase